MLINGAKTTAGAITQKLFINSLSSKDIGCCPPFGLFTQRQAADLNLSCRLSQPHERYQTLHHPDLSFNDSDSNTGCHYYPLIALNQWNLAYRTRHGVLGTTDQLTG